MGNYNIVDNLQFTVSLPQKIQTQVTQTVASFSQLTVSKTGYQYYDSLESSLGLDPVCENVYYMCIVVA